MNVVQFYWTIFLHGTMWRGHRIFHYLASHASVLINYFFLKLDLPIWTIRCLPLLYLSVVDLEDKRCKHQRAYRLSNKSKSKQTMYLIFQRKLPICSPPADPAYRLCRLISMLWLSASLSNPKLSIWQVTDQIHHRMFGMRLCHLTLSEESNGETWAWYQEKECGRHAVLLWH